MRISFLTNLTKQAEHMIVETDRNDLVYSIRKSSNRRLVAILISCTLPFLSKSSGFGTMHLFNDAIRRENILWITAMVLLIRVDIKYLPIFELIFLWSSIRSFAKPSKSASDAGRCFLKKQLTWYQCGSLASSCVDWNK